MNASPRALNDLIGSRICHDLISPIGAISNGVELISMNATTAGPELSLISDSVDGANAKIRYFRIAFGAAHQGQMVNRSEVVNILADTTRGSRLVIEWAPESAQDRTQVKLALLLLMCFETALPWGGRVQVNAIGDQWAINAKADKIKIDPDLWRKLSDTATDTPSEPANVHFALAGLFAQDMGRSVNVDVSETSVRVRF
jgi:histidine phosphotransferase ChpT